MARTKLGERLRAIRFDHVLVSPLQRARKTCELAGCGAHAIIEPDLIEWDNGEYEGRTHAEVFNERPGWNLFVDGSPGGEMPDQIARRADGLIERLNSLEGNVALFSHSHFGRVLGARWIGAPVQLGQHLILSTASLSVLTSQADHENMRVIEKWNS
ncbi:histidine phosphatase family protein [Rhodopirellula sp. ICT_H3.1]|uniref:Histidine phosphatase family protein n=1 Tax=Aporhodopirellula aestuarii TaxID=2950107 RepID=A0ABT0U0B0_9BACT|nr:histidine phosphatase family protein [Aporhodopirellula aestuarii]MCM2370318.1 histidine phosphatase family protein [Aporhodopirellula aestuarii]